MEEMTTYTPFDLKHIRELLRLIVEVPSMMRLDPGRAAVVLDALDRRDALLRELVDQTDAWLRAEVEHAGVCNWCDGYYASPERYAHDPDCLITRARALLTGDGQT